MIEKKFSLWDILTIIISLVKNLIECVAYIAHAKKPLKNKVRWQNSRLLNKFFMCLEINGLKYLKLAILRFLPSPPITYTTLIAVETFFIVKTLIIIHKFTWIHINSHNFYTYVLKYIFWGSNYFGVYGCWLVWQLLYVFMVADWLVWLLICLTVLFYQELKIKKIIFFLSKFSPQAKLCNIDMYKYKFKMYKGL